MQFYDFQCIPGVCGGLHAERIPLLIAEQQLCNSRRTDAFKIQNVSTGRL